MVGASVKLENISVVFNRGTPNETVALNGVNLDIAPGQVVIIQGGNGSGKSTLIKVIAGIYRPTEGRVFIDDHDVTKQKDYVRARQMSFVHQDPLLGTAPSLNLFENLTLAGLKRWWLPLPYGFNLQHDQETALECTGLGLGDRLPVPLTNFSGGQRQAIAIGIAFSRNARLVLLDEFTASLDYKTSKTVAIEAIKRAKGTHATTIMIMHDRRLANLLNAKFLNIEAGAICKTHR
jgi:putative ABC transport system ATP-binding protein